MELFFTQHSGVIYVGKRNHPTVMHPFPPTRHAEFTTEQAELVVESLNGVSREVGVSTLNKVRAFIDQIEVNDAKNKVSH